VTAGTAALGAVVLAAPIPAYAGGEYLRVTPSTVQAGYHIDIEGYCGDNVNPAKATSDAFGVVTIMPQQDTRGGRYVHRGTATIPDDMPPRAYPVTMVCPNNQAATTTLHVVSNSVPSRGPRTGGGALASNPLGGNGFTLAGAGALALGGALLLVKRRKRT
jgi:LPXTG-motif cell wall-anchored protein